MTYLNQYNFVLNQIENNLSNHFMKSITKIYFSAIAFFLTLISVAQNTTDTLQISREYSADQDFTSAIAVLEKYHQNNPNNVFAVQLLASNYYWNGDVEKADSTYQHSIKAFNNNPALKLDYGRMLYDLGTYKTAKVVLDDYLETNPQNIEALEYTGYINYWWGRNDKSLDKFNKILEQYPNNSTALNMAQLLNRVKRPYLLLGYNYAFDTQPMQSGNARIETGRYYSTWLNPTLKLDWLHFNAEGVKNQTPWIQVGNQMNFFKNKTHFNAVVGYLQQADGNAQFTGLFELSQDLTRNISLKIAAESSPYFYTTSSLLTPVMYNGVNASLHLSYPKGFTAQAFAGRQYFMDGNQIDNYYAWALSPSFGWEKLKINMGYSFNYTNSVENHYVPTKTLDEAIATYPEKIDGIYNPYFTPVNQNIHSVLASFSLNKGKTFEWQLKSSVGFFAYADIPYFYLDRRGNGGNFFINSGIDKQYLVPYEITLIAIYNINENTLLNFSYTTTENFFYHNNVISLSLKHIF